MVLAIASVLLVALLMGVIFSSVMFSVGNTTATRAHAASRAAAEGGAQQVARKLLQKTATGPTSCSGLGVPSDAWIKYKVDGVWFQEKESDPNWKRCDNGGPGIPKLAHAVRVKTTGYSDSAGTNPGGGAGAVGAGDKGSIGQQGNKRGDTSTVEMTFVRADSLDLNKAVFGDLSVLSNTNFKLYSDPAHPDRPHTQLPPDVVTNKTWVCPSNGVLEGSVYALGGATVSTDCLIQGDFYIAGTLNIGQQLTVEGDLYIDGDLSGSKMHIDGNVLVNGDLSLSSNSFKFKEDVRVTGKFETSDKLTTAFDKFLYTGGGPGSLSNTGETITHLGGRFKPNWTMTEPEWELPSILNSPANPQTPEEIEETKFPMLRQDDPVFSGFTSDTWANVSGGTREGALCSAYGFTGPIQIDSPTKIDISQECTDWRVAGLKLELKADLVLFVPSMKMNGAMSVKTLNAPGDETRHSLYIIALPKTNQDSCAANRGGSIKFATGQWDQQDASDGQIRTKVLLYAGDEVSINSKLSNIFNGQIYACDVSVQSGIDMIFAQAGQDRTDTLWDLGIGSVRDITS